MDLFLTIVIASLVFVTSGLGGHLASTKSWHKLVFWGLGFLTLILIIIQATLNASNKPLTFKEAQDLFSKATSTTSAQVPTSPPTDDANKPITKADFLKLIQHYQSSQSTRDLRQKEYELSKQLRKLESDHRAALDRIERNRPPPGSRNWTPTGGVAATYAENRAFDDIFETLYLGRAISLRNEMLARLPLQPRPEQSIPALEGFVDTGTVNELVDYLDELAAKLP